MYPSHVRLSRSPKKAKKTYKDIQAAVSFKAELGLLQNISFQFEPDTPSTIPLYVKISVYSSKEISVNSSFPPALLKLSTSFYYSLFHYSMYTISTQIDPVEYNFFF